MTIDDQIKDEKLQYNINREAAKLSALSSGKIHTYEHLTVEDILPSNQQQILKQAKVTYSPLGKAFDKQIKTIEDQGEKQVETLNTFKFNDIKLKNKDENKDKNKDENKDEYKDENIFPKSAFSNDEAEDEFNKIKKMVKSIDRENYFMKLSNINMILENLKQQEHLVKIFMKVKFH